MTDKLSEITYFDMSPATRDKKTKIILKNNHIPIAKVILVNCILDFKSFLKKNFIESKKGYIGLSLISLFFINRKRPFIYNLKNNYEMSNSLVTKNKIIKVNSIEKPFERKLNSEEKSNNNFIFSYSFEYKLINNTYNKLLNIKNFFSNLKNKDSIRSDSK